MPKLRKIILLLLLFPLAACNLTTQQQEPTIVATEEPTEAPEIPTETVTIPTITNLPELPTVTIEVQALPTSSFNAINTSSATPAPIGVRAPTQQSNLSDQLTPLPTSGQSTSASPTNEAMPFPDRFTESYDVNANQGRTIYVTYEAVINNPGTGRVFIEIRDPAGEVVGQLIITEAATDEFEVVANTSGTHQVLVASQNLRGYYSVSYGTR